MEPTSLLFAALAVPAMATTIHRIWLMWLASRPSPVPAGPSGTSGRISVLVPTFNEDPDVVGRLLRALVNQQLDEGALEILILDDSDDGTEARLRDLAASLSAPDRPIHLWHRAARKGYKAGALHEALALTDAAVFAIFDADFVPGPTFVQDALRELGPRIGAVQARWDFENADKDWLTMGQAVLIDAHFRVGQQARTTAGLWTVFNGSAGVWRREAIADAGGWSADTLTEDLDLSLRASMCGWPVRYVDRLSCPSLLPDRLHDYRLQQERWTRGALQTALKLLPSITRAPLARAARLDAISHLSVRLHGFGLCLLGIVTPLAAVGSKADGWIATFWAAGLALNAVVLVAASSKRGWTTVGNAKAVAAALVLVLGMTTAYTLTVLSTLVGRPLGFVRTRKGGAHADAIGRAPSPTGAYGLGAVGFALLAAIALRNGSAAVALIPIAFSAAHLLFAARLVADDRAERAHSPAVSTNAAPPA